jgi:cyclopropane-fatty-acyl-phospholipid synthase
VYFSVAMSVQGLLESILGDDLPVRVSAYDGSSIGPLDAPATVHLRSPAALRRMITGLGRELAFARAYVAGEIDIDGDIFAVVALRDRIGNLRPTTALLRQAFAALDDDDGTRPIRKLRPLPPPPEEVRLHGLRHSKSRDAEAIAAHYDVSNEFYRIVLGESLTYSCAVYEHADDSLEQAQANKHELICRKLDLQPGMRLLDIGCGWGSLALHAAEQHGVDAVGVTISRQQQQLATERVRAAGLADRVTIRLQDYREIDDGPYDAVSSVGMFEHVGVGHLAEYFNRIHRLVRPGGRLLNHGIARPPGSKETITRGGFVDRYVFPDGELVEVGKVTTALQSAGFELRHSESLREHYALTLRAWVTNLERNWEAAVAEVGSARARIWRLYMAGSALGFENGTIRIHQLLGVHLEPTGSSGMPLRTSFEATPLSADA